MIGGRKRVLYLCHKNADPDALGAAFSLREAFGGDLAAVEGVSKTGGSLLEAIGAEVLIDPSVEEYDLVVVVDTGGGASGLGDLPRQRLRCDRSSPGG